MATAASNLAVSFRLFSEEQIEHLAACEVTNASTFDHGVPKPGGLQDAHMGTTDRSILCQTCHQAHCAGHFGVIRLPMRIILPGHLKRVCLLVRCFCTVCASPLLSDAAVLKAAKSLRGFERLKAVSDAARKQQKCGTCAAPVASVTESNKLFLSRTFTPEQLNNLDAEEKLALTSRFMPDDAWAILNAAPQSFWTLLGINPEDSHPRDAIPRLLLVLPPAQRPTLRIADGGKGRGEDDMTVLYQELVRSKVDLENKMASPATVESEIFNSFAKTQLAVACLVKNAYRKTVEVKGVVDHGGSRGKVRTLRDLEHRLKGKTGRLRGTLNAKRTDFSARTVVGIDMVRNVWELGMPISRMKTLTFPERVTELNLEKLKEKVRRGAAADGGAVNVIEATGNVENPKMIFLGLMSATQRTVLAESLEIGWIVERHIEDGDWVLFNRQPTLHKMNMQAFRVYGVPGLTFRLPLPATRPFNADYDGDEMNMHCLQSIEAVAEAQEIMSVPHNMISPSNTAAIIAPVQETLVAWFRLTSRNTLLTRDHYFQLLAQASFDAKARDYDEMPHGNDLGWGPTSIEQPAIIKSPRGPMWTGKQVASALLPSTINIVKAVRDGDMKEQESWLGHKEDVVVIKNGKVLLGRLCKSLLGGGVSLVHNIWKDISPWAAAKFVSDVQRVGNLWNQMDAACIGIRDCIVPLEIEAKVDTIIAAAMAKAETVSSTSFSSDVKEARISGVMQDVLRSAGAEVLHQIDSESAMAQVVFSGSKGNVLNISQIAAVVGQQSLGGRRVPQRRTRLGPRGLICFPPGDTRPEALGFVATSYLQGLTEHEYFHAMMAGREGIVATAVETATSGYNQRKMTKIQEGQVTAYDRSVRTTDQSIVSFHYGGDDMDATRLERVRVASIRLSDDAIHSMADGDKDETELMIAARNTLRNACTSTVPGEAKPMITLPFQPERLTDIVVQQSVHGQACAATREQHRRWLVRLTKSILTLWRDKLRDDITFAQLVSILKNRTLRTDKPWAKILAAVYLTWPYQSIADAKMSEKDLDKLGEELQSKIRAALITPGEAVGTIGATSIGEPSTQGALNVFHFSGIAEKNAMAGLPRFKQLINAARASDTCNMSVLVDDEGLTTRLKSVYLRDILHTYQVKTSTATSILEPREALLFPWAASWMTPLFSKADLPKQAAQHQAKSAGGPTTVNWVLELVLHKPRSLTCGTTPTKVRDRLVQAFADTAFVLATEAYEAEWVVRIRPLELDIWKIGAEFDGRAACEAILDTLQSKFLISGLAEVKDSYMARHVEDQVAQETGGLQRRQSRKVGTLGSDVRGAAWLLPSPSLSTKLFTNDVPETAEVLGIEAATLLQNEELQRVLCFDSTYVDPRHTLLLADTMSRCGFVAPLNRHKMEELGSSLLQQASFEQTLPVLEDAAFFSKRDPLTGSIERQILGLPLRVGTGLVALQTREQDQEERRVVLAPLKKDKSTTSLAPLRKREPVDSSASFLTLKPLHRGEWNPHVTEGLPPALQSVASRAALAASAGGRLRGELVGPALSSRFEAMLHRASSYCGWDEADETWKQSCAVTWGSNLTLTDAGRVRNMYRKTLVCATSAWVEQGLTLETRAQTDELLGSAQIPHSVVPRHVVIRQRRCFVRDGWSFIFDRSWSAATQLDAEAALLTTPPRLRFILQRSPRAHPNPIVKPEEELVGKLWGISSQLG